MTEQRKCLLYFTLASYNLNGNGLLWQVAVVTAIIGACVSRASTTTRLILLQGTGGSLLRKAALHRAGAAPSHLPPGAAASGPAPPTLL